MAFGYRRKLRIKFYFYVIYHMYVCVLWKNVRDTNQTQQQQQSYSISNGYMPCDIFQTTMKTKLMIVYIVVFINANVLFFVALHILWLCVAVVVLFFMMAEWMYFVVERVIYVLFPAFFYEFQPKKKINKESKETKHSHSTYKCKLARWNYQIAWLQSKLMQENKNRIPAIECHTAISLPPYRILFLKKVKQQKFDFFFVLCILSSKLICLFCNIFSDCQIRIGWCVCALEPESHSLACVLLIQCFPLVINASICHFKINWCGFHIIYAFARTHTYTCAPAHALHTFFWFCPKVFFSLSIVCSLQGYILLYVNNLAHLFLTILHFYALQRICSLLSSVTFAYGYRW